MKPSGDHDAEAASGPVPQTPLERLLDVGLYAPLGLLTKRGGVVRDLAAAGRKQAAFSRSLGRAALKAVAAGSRAAQSAAQQPSGERRSATQSEQASVAEITGYSALTAREIVAMIPACTTEQREWIQATEQAGKARVTILRALSDG